MFSLSFLNNRTKQHDNIAATCAIPIILPSLVLSKLEAVKLVLLLAHVYGRGGINTTGLCGFGGGGKFKSIYTYIGCCQNYGPVLGTLNIRCRIIMGTPKGTIILTITHIHTYYHYIHGYGVAEYPSSTAQLADRQ